ncbi:kinase domain containing protein [Babesia ovis]|uniref:Kinase domain containing protein n=1 Tax=Babesia ovis TaxID=5869 RepID=A0A9W5WTQ7_BABOV|nr:kinase domain containing protein [Babesia ovis]
MNSSSVICRVRKARDNTYEDNKDDHKYLSCYRGTTVVDLKNEQAPNHQGSHSSCRTISQGCIHGNDTPIPTTYNKVGPLNNNGAHIPADTQWPPSAIEVLHDLENYVEINFADYRPLYDRVGPMMFRTSLQEGLFSPAAELRLLPDTSSLLISQNSTQRVVYNAYWLPKQFPKIALKVAVKSVKDYNVRDGRSIKREIGCHLYIYQKLMAQSLETSNSSRLSTDDWPTSEVLGYYLDKKNPGTSLLITRKLFGPDFFDIIRSECSPRFASRNTPLYELNKLDWCIIAMERVAQFSELGIRHNDLKPDNIVLDMYESCGVKRVDVKVIDLGAASMEGTKEFTGGTSWYESPEQKLLEFYTKKHHNSKRAQTIDIGRASDAWGIGQSVIEVLLGRRMVDHLRPPFGTGPPELLNPPQDVEEGEVDPLWWDHDEYWTIPPRIWLATIRNVLQMDSPNQKFPICAKAARFVFDRLMLVDPRKRASVRSVAEGLRHLAKGEIAKHI